MQQAVAVAWAAFQSYPVDHAEDSDDEQRKAVEAAVRAALSSIPDVKAVPVGYALVPLEPTEDMVKAYLQANNAYWQRTDEMPPPPNRWRTGRPFEATAESYKAMIAAASSAQKEPGETGMDERKTDGVTACPPVGQDVAFNEAERLVLELRNAVWQAQSLAETREAEDALMQFLRRAFGVDVPDAGQPKGGA
jgi:hypothetical protein